MEEKNKKFGGASNHRFNYQGKRPQRNTRGTEIRTFIADEGKTSVANQETNTTVTPRERRVFPKQHDRRDMRGTHSNGSNSNTHSRSNSLHANRKAMMISSKAPRLPQQKFETQKKDQNTSNKKSTKQIPPPLGDTIRIIPLGGVEEIGRNMTVIEYKNDKQKKASEG
jgi:hypothetical protein